MQIFSAVFLHSDRAIFLSRRLISKNPRHAHRQDVEARFLALKISKFVSDKVVLLLECRGHGAAGLKAAYGARAFFLDGLFGQQTLETAGLYQLRILLESSCVNKRNSRSSELPNHCGQTAAVPVNSSAPSVRWENNAAALTRLQQFFHRSSTSSEHSVQQPWNITFNPICLLQAAICSQLICISLFIRE